MPPRSEPMPRGEGPKRRTPIKRTAAKPKRPRDTGPTTKVRQIIRGRSGGWCELALPCCSYLACQASHRLAKKKGGRHGEMRKRVNGAAWILDACPECHRAITSAEEPLLSEYRDAGLLLREGQDARLVPVRSRHFPRPVLLDDEGGWRCADP